VQFLRGAAAAGVNEVIATLTNDFAARDMASIDKLLDYALNGALTLAALLG